MFILENDKFLIENFDDGQLQILYQTYQKEKVPQIQSLPQFKFDYQTDLCFEGKDLLVCKHNGECIGYIVGSCGKNTKTRCFVPTEETVYVLKEFCFSDCGEKTEEYAKKFFEYLKKMIKTKWCSWIQFENTDSRFSAFYENCQKLFDMEPIENFLTKYVSWCIESHNKDGLTIRGTYCGEEYEISKEPLWIEEGEETLGYIESDHIRYTYGFDYIVGIVDEKNDYFGYFIGEAQQQTIQINGEEKIINVYVLKDFYIYYEDDSKYYFARRLFDYMQDLVSISSCKRIQFMISDKRFSPFYEFCKKELNMIERDGLLIKEL